MYLTIFDAENVNVFLIFFTLFCLLLSQVARRA